MPKNIVICSDGTGNTSIKGRGTNVFKLFEAVDLQGYKTDESIPRQVAIYDDGVGTSNVQILRLLGGAFGWGLSRNVKELYNHLARVYEPDDKIFLFGFSRGAFTVRTLLGLIATCGIPDRRRCDNDAQLRSLVKDAYRIYREKYYRTIWGTMFSWVFGKNFANEQADNFCRQHGVGGDIPTVEFIGVWDTVDAVGLPFDHAAWFLNHIYRFKFTDHKLAENVKRACHALSIDDERHTFHPLLWDERGAEDRIQQVWFPGVHSNVGGGYPKQGMSLESLDWIMTHAEHSGLKFISSDRELYRERRNINDKLYDSRAGWGMYYRYKPRDIAAICAKHGAKPRVHVSTIERLLYGPDAYAPGNLPFENLELVSTDRTEVGHSAISQYLRSVGATHLSGKSLLHSVTIWVHVRCYTHYAFVASSILAFLSDLGSVMVIAAATCWYAGLHAKQRMATAFSSFWYSLESQLKEIHYARRPH